jgi:hypothetical protein
MAGIQHLQTPAKSHLSNSLRTGSSATRENRFSGNLGQKESSTVDSHPILKERPTRW